jgi:nitric oxide reductase NorD protein
MDILEKLFEKVVNRYAQKNKKSSSLVEFSKHEKYLNAFASALFGKEQAPLVSASLGFVGLNNGVLFLPDKIDLFRDVELNKKIYINLILITAAAYKLNIRQQKSHNPLVSRFEFLKQMPLINSYLDQEFASYKNFQNDIISKIKELKKHKYFELWEKNYSVRTATEAFVFDMPVTKINEVIPDFIFLTLPCLSASEGSFARNNLKFNSQSGEKNQQEEITTELKKKNNGITEYVDLEQEKANPVTHSFEKLETADEYQGGYRFDSGDDQLNDHSKALEELSLSKVTRGGEAAKSVYSADGVLNFHNDSEAVIFEPDKNFSYPEWNVKSANYLINHCLLVEKVVNVSDTQNHAQELSKKYRKEIDHWKKRLSSLINYPLWKNRLFDGEEIDFDNFLHDYASLKANVSVDQRWYSSKKKAQQEMAVLILFDQSMSADSWVQNRRVLDVITDSVGLMGLIFEDLITNIQVAGTFSETRHHCYYQIYKKEQSPWSDFFNSVSQIQAQGYTRLGPAIRHAAAKLKESKAEKKLLILITDGKPTDLDGYEGKYGISDVKKSCSEAEGSGILPFALTVDKEAKQFFPKMFNHYSVLSNPDQLPQELYGIVFKLLRSLKS